MAPFRSRQQQRWAYSKAGTKALGGKRKVAEWQRATGKRKLPSRVKKK